MQSRRTATIRSSKPWLIPHFRNSLQLEEYHSSNASNQCFTRTRARCLCDLRSGHIRRRLWRGQYDCARPGVLGCIGRGDLMSFDYEPAIWLGIVQAVLVLLIAFGMPISNDQKVAIVGVAGALLALIGSVIVRSRVSPVASVVLPPH